MWDVIGRCEALKLLGFGPGGILEEELLELVDRVEQIDASATIGISWLEEPHVGAVEEGVPHRDSGRLSHALSQLHMMLYVAVHRCQSFCFAWLISSLVVLIFVLFDDVEVVDELIKLILTERRPQVYHEGDRDDIEDI